MAGHSVVILGGGTGGIVAAQRLRRELPRNSKVVLVEHNPVYRFAPSFLWVMSGARRPEQVTVDFRGLARRGVELTQAEVREIDVGSGRVETSTGSIPYDRLVVPPGAQLPPHPPP